jgi:hypothetical protein
MRASRRTAPDCSRQRWSIAEGLTVINPVHAGNLRRTGIRSSAGERRTLVLAIAHISMRGDVGTGSHYFYTRSYASLADVLHTALDHSSSCDRARHA